MALGIQQNFSGATYGIVRKASVVAGIEVSSLTSEAHTIANQATKQALEDGAQVSDHVIQQPIEVSIVFSMANASASFREDGRDVFDYFAEMQEKRELVDLVTEHRIYEDVILTSFTPMHTAPFKAAYSATVTFQQMNLVTLSVVGRSSKRLAKDGTSKTGVGMSDEGKREPEDPGQLTGLQKIKKGITS